jgi:hypothetical protein
MKRGLISICLSLAIVGSLSNSLFGSSLAVSSGVVVPGMKDVLITLLLDSDMPYSGFELNVHYDHLILTLKRIEAVPRVSGQSNVEFKEYDYGKLALLVYDMDGAALTADSGTIFNLYFDINPEAVQGYTMVALSGVTAVSEQLAYDTVSVTDGIITIQCTGVDDEDENDEQDTPRLSYCLRQNYPNPFNPITKIEYDLAEESKVLLEIYNVNGQRVRTLVAMTQPSGKYSVAWDGKDVNGRSVASGVYFCMIKANKYRSTNKMVLLR